MVERIFLVLLLDDLNTLDVLVPLDTEWGFKVNLEGHRIVNPIHHLM